MSSLQDRFLLLLQEFPHITKADLARAAGVKQPSVSDWFSGKTKTLKAEPASKIAKKYGISAHWLATGQGAMRDDIHANTSPAELGGRRVPLISLIQAGNWREVVDNFQPGDAEEWLYTDAHLTSGAFALQIVGNSMEPEFREGDRVIIDPGVAPRPGSFVAAVNGQSAAAERQATFKKYRPRCIDEAGNVIFELVPLNDDYPTLRSDVQPIEIIGTMVEHRRYFR